MAGPLFFGNVKDSSATTGTGAYLLDGAASADVQAIADRLSNGDTAYFMVKAVDASGVPTGAWESGLYTYDTGSPGPVLVRTRVDESSNGDAAVDWAAGTKHIALVNPALNVGGDFVQVTNDGSTTQAVTGGSFVKVAAVLTTVVSNRNSWWNTTTKLFLPITNGPKVYLISATVSVDPLADGKGVIVALYKNGAEFMRGFRCINGAAGGTSGQCTGLIELNGVDDYVEVYVLHSDTGSKNLTAGAAINNFSAKSIGV